MQFDASVIVTIYEPAERPVAVAAFWAGAVFHEYVKAPVPPVAEAIALPFVPPKQPVTLIGVTDPAGAPMSSTFATPVAEHPLASVIVKVYKLAASPEIVEVAL